MIEIKVPLPRECFENFMSPVKDGDADGLERDEHGQLVPANVNKKSRTINKFDYLIRRPMVTDRL
eukprot:4727015-Pleurochrysis_carterae.AAC.1